MQIKDYLNEILDVLSANPFIESQNLAFEERPPNAAFITGTIIFTNSAKLHFKEFVVFIGNIGNIGTLPIFIMSRKASRKTEEMK